MRSCMCRVLWPQTNGNISVQKHLLPYPLFLPCECCQVLLPVFSDSVLSHTFKCSFSICYSIRNQPPPETLQYPEHCVGSDPELGQSVTRMHPYERVLCILTHRLHSYAYTIASSLSPPQLCLSGQQNSVLLQRSQMLCDFTREYVCSYV